MTKGAGTDPLLFEFFNEIGIIEQLARTRMERELPRGLTLSQFSVLNHFVRLGGEKSPVELARAFQVTKGAMTNSIQKLEAKGFVEIAPDPNDGRAKKIRINDAGREAREEGIAALVDQFPLLLTAFDGSEFEKAIPFLRRLRMFLDENRDVRVSEAAQ